MNYLGKVNVLLKAGINDPQGISILSAAHSLGFKAVTEVRAGKYLEVMLSEQSKASAEQQLHKLCTSMLTNPLIESYTLEIDEIK